MRRPHLALAIALAAAGCADGQGVVVVTVAGSVQGVVSLHVAVTNDGQPGAPADLALPGAPLAIPPAITFSISFDSSRHGAVTVDVAARDANGRTLAEGIGLGSVTPSETSAITVLLSPGSGDGGGPPPDGGPGDGAPPGDAPRPDLAGADLAGDAARPPDLSTFDLTPPGPCQGMADGTVCGTVTYGNWSACDYGGNQCANGGNRVRGVMTPTCSQGACGTVTTTQNDAAGCARNVDGTACGSNVVCSGGNCVCGPNACGPNNCGGCGAGDYCDPGGHCQCAPRACDNVYCGPDGCGGTCECDGANGQQCMDDTTQSSCCYVSGHYCTFGDPCCNGACNFAASSCP